MQAKTTSGDAASSSPTADVLVTHDLFEEALARCVSALEAHDLTAVEGVLRSYPQYRSELVRFIENHRVADEAAEVYAGAVMATDEFPMIDGYAIKEMIGMGGMGVVYRAYSQKFDHEVALKVMRSDRAFTAAHKQHFWKEAEIAFKLHNRGIASVFDRGGYDSRPYYAMQFVDGKSLKQWIAEGERWHEGSAKKLIIELADALTVAHRKGVVHRDLKPGNILIDDSDKKPWIIDFGLALTADGPREAEGFVGTWGYAPPEQVRGESHITGPQADVYALGVILFELLTGVQPFAGETPAQVKQRTLEEVPQWPKRNVPLRLEPRLASICMKCLEKEPSQRFADAEELGVALRRKPGYPIWPYFVYLAISISCAVLLQWLLLQRLAEPLAWLAFMVSLGSVLIVLRSDDNDGLLPANVPEKALWAIWGGVVLADAALAAGLARVYRRFCQRASLDVCSLALSGRCRLLRDEHGVLRAQLADRSGVVCRRFWDSRLRADTLGGDCLYGCQLAVRVA